ncbi:MAG TPA: methyltransferase domain-containing protein [Fibrobacteria bacterium]|nr:methyltransferase domain-containing protein [Fibrobacteria bacterium]
MNPFEISVQRFDEFADQYANRFMNVADYAESLAVFCNIALPRPGILDLACGPGNYTMYLKNQFPESRIIGIDLAPKMLEIAKNKLPEADFLLMDIKEVAKLTENFDLIICSFGLPFLSKQESAKLILDCSGKLNAKGRLYLSTMEGEESKAGFEPTSFSGSSEIYFNYHLSKDIENTLKAGGLDVIQARKQDYFEPDGTKSTDLLFVAEKP